MALSATIYTVGAGEVGQTEWDLTFEGYVANPPGYLSKTHITFWLNDVQVTLGGGATEYDGSGITFSWVTATRVSIAGYSPVLNDKIEFRRTIPKDDVWVNFVDRAGITESQLDGQNLANLYSIHEIMDGFGTGSQSYYALAKLYANADEDVEVEAGNYSSKHFSLKAAASALAALTSQNAAASSESAAAASEAQTIANAAATAADLVQTNLDQIACAADAVSTAADAAATAADLVQTDIDQAAAAASAAAALVSQNAAAASETAAGLSETAAAASETAAGLSETNAAASEAKAEDWATELEDVEVETGKYSALHWAAKAEAAAESGLFKETEHTATAGQTLFDHNSAVLNEQISINGAIIGTADYSVSGEEVTLTAGAAAGDIVRIQTIGLIAVNEYVPLSGNSTEPMTGQLRLAGAPSDDDDASNKAYVDGAVGGNLLVNGEFNIWQRGTSFSTQGFTADRWLWQQTGGALQIDKDTLILTAQPNSDFLTKNALQAVTAGLTGASDYAQVVQRCEDVKRFGNRILTFSFDVWTNVGGTPELNIRQVFDFGTGGSADIAQQATNPTLVDSTWNHVVVTFPAVDITAKTITDTDSFMSLNILTSAGSSIRSGYQDLPQQSGYWYFTNAKLEYGPVATPFVKRTIAEELALCQRYYWYGTLAGKGQGRHYALNANTYLNSGSVSFPVTMRESPTLTIEVAPTYLSCANATVFGNEDGFVQRVTATASTTIAAYDGQYSADAEL